LIRAPLHRICPGVGAALALLTLASPLLVTFHEASVRHVTCPEHGELVDPPLRALSRAEADQLSSLHFERKTASRLLASRQGHWSRSHPPRMASAKWLSFLERFEAEQKARTKAHNDRDARRRKALAQGQRPA
jgi:hypothetical protein